MAAHKNYLLNDKFPKAIKNATSTNDGLMSSEDKARLDSVFEFGLLSPVTPEKDGIMTKEDKIKLDGIEENANYYVHPDDENTRHVSDAEKNKWNTQTKYTNRAPTPVKVGGIEAGSTFDNVDHNTLFTQLLYPYIDPTISNIVITPNTTILENGNRFNLTRLQFNIKTPSLSDTESIHYDFKMNGAKFHSLDTNNRTIDTAVNTSINANTSITVTVVDNINNKQKDFTLINYKFIYPMYYGVLEESDSLTQVLLKSKTKLLQDKGNKNIKFTSNNQKIMFAYPKSYGNLTSIYDANNFNIINTFTVQELNITAADSKSVAYYVYINEASTVTDYNISFRF